MRTLSTLAIVLICAGAQAATVNTKLTVNAKASLSLTTGAFTANGTATLDNIGSGTFAGTLPASGIGADTATANFIITLSGGATLAGTISAPAVLLLGATTTGNASATITGGSGAYAGATGSFPNLAGSGSGSITAGVDLTFSGNGTITTGGGSAGPTPPAITAVWDAAGNTPTLAPGIIFIVKGTNLCPSGVKFYDIPRPTVSSDGVKITFTSSGGSATDALIWYTYNPSGTCQLAGILPSSVAPGNYNVTVTNGAASAPFAATVAAAKPALFTQDSTGTGLASVQNYISSSVVDVNKFTTGVVSNTSASPAHPGQFIQAYGTGLGGVQGADNTASPVYDFTQNGATVRAVVGGMTIPATFAGRAGYAGEDQINFQLPANVQTGCTVPFQISINGVSSNSTFLAIAPDSGSDACVAPGFSKEQLQRFDQGGTYTVGVFYLSQLTQSVPTFGTIKANVASGSFVQFSGFQLASGSAQATDFSIAPGSCSVIHTTSAPGSTSPPVNYATLDAGTVTLNGPPASSISNRPFKQNVVADPTTGRNIIAYTLALATEGLPSIPGVPADTGTIVGGTYTLSGAGGKDIGRFNATISVGTPLTVTGGLPSTVNRSAGLTVNWTGGNATDLVQISGGSSSRTGSGSSAITESWSFTCYATAGQGSFTVPASILTQIPPIAVGVNGSGGNLQVVTTPTPGLVNGSFSAPLTAGGSIDNGQFFALIGTSGVVAYQ